MASEFEMWGSDEFKAWDEPVTKKTRIEVLSQKEVAGSKRTMSLGTSCASLRAMSSTALPRTGKKTVYEETGSDPDDVKRRLQNASCKCQGRPCHRAVKLKALIAVCQLFWGLAAEERAMLLRTEYCFARETGADEEEAEPQGEDAESSRMAATEWHLCGAHVCFPMFCYLLRTGQHFVRKAIHGESDMRAVWIGGEKMPLRREAPQTAAVDWFFQELYQSAAEPLPEDVNCANLENVDLAISQGEFETPWPEDWGQTRPQHKKKGKAKAAAPAVQQFSSSAVASTSAAQASSKIESQWIQTANSCPSLSLNPVCALTVACATSVLGLPVRYLPHQTLSNLYWQFTSTWEQHMAWHRQHFFQKMPSYNTFANRFRAHWRKVLQLRKGSQHAQCQTCFELQQLLRSPKANWGQKAQAARDLRQHYQNQYLDRCLYWSLRWQSRHSSEVLTIIIDSMDKDWQFCCLAVCCYLLVARLS